MFRLVADFDRPTFDVKLKEEEDLVEVIDPEADLEAKLETVRQESYAQGLEDGKQAGIQQAKDETATLVKHLNRMFEEVVAQRGALLQEAETLIVRLVLAIARKVVHRELMNHPETINTIVRETLRYVVDKDRVVVKVNPKDYNLLQDMQKEIPIKLQDVKELQFEEESIIERGGCIIETNSGTIDARLETQFELIESDLLEKAFDE